MIRDTDDILGDCLTLIYSADQSDSRQREWRQDDFVIGLVGTCDASSVYKVWCFKELQV